MPLLRTRGRENAATKWGNVGAAMGLTRKVLRVGRPIGITKGMIERLLQASAKPNAHRMVLAKTLADLSLTLFFLFDHVMLVCKMLEWAAPAKVDFLSNFFWLLESIFTVIHEVDAIVHRGQVIMNMRKTMGDRRLSKDDLDALKT